MDKTWMSKNRTSDEYKNGVDSFMKFASQHVGGDELMSCPCKKCGNVIRKQVDVVKYHLLMNGMDLSYHTWIWHGERLNSDYPMSQQEELEPGGHGVQSDEPIDMIHAAFKGSENPEDFVHILEDAEKPLYPGCEKFTKLSAVMKLYNLKAKYSWSDRSFTDLLILLREMLPALNEIPLSVYDAKKSLATLGMKYEKIHACPNDCILYRNAYKDYITCPTCGASRWKTSKNTTSSGKIPEKVLWYFPPIPRFQRMFQTKHISKDMTWYTRRSDYKMRYPADSPCWKHVDLKWPEFAHEARNLRLALSADGINPYSTMTSTYSCWPVMLVTYNLPPWLCFKRRFIMLTLLIAGPKQPGNDIDVYLAPLIDDLSILWKTGVQTYDAYLQESFTLRAVLLWTINDFPAYGNLSGCKVKGYKACPICVDQTYAKRLKYSRKMSFMGTRRYLRQINHPYRKQKKLFDGTQEFRPAPKPMSGCDILKAVDGIKVTWGKKSKSKEIGDKIAWNKKSIFFELEYWEHLHVRHNLDVMHIEKNICESLLGTLLDMPGKTKDGIASRKDLVDMNLRPELAPHVEEKRTYLPSACYTLSRGEKRKVCESLAGMKVPTNYSSNVRNLVSLKDLKLVGLKSHDCHTLMQQLLPVAIRGVLPTNVRCAIIRLCFFFNALCSKVIDVSKLDDIQDDIVTTLCLLEKYFPPSFFDIMVHLTVHLVREVKLCGPVWYRWMYPFERYMRVLKSYVKNRNRPEGCIAECYIAEEAVEFCSMYMSNMQTCGVPNTQQPSKSNMPLSAAKVQYMSDVDLHQAHLHVLTNEAEIDHYAKLHKAHLKKTSRGKSKSDPFLQKEHNRYFPDWLRDQVGSNNDHSTQPDSEKLKWLARGPNNNVLKYDSYVVRGVTFYTKDHDAVRSVQNSGVTLVAKTIQVSSAKDKNPIESDMVFYGVIDEIFELDYHQFRIPMFKCSWADNNTAIKDDKMGFTLVNLNKLGFKDDAFILASQETQVFYITDLDDSQWCVAIPSPLREYLESDDPNEDDESIVHHPCSVKELPTNLDDVRGDNDPIYLRDDCDGIWIDNADN